LNYTRGGAVILRDSRDDAQTVSNACLSLSL